MGTRCESKDGDDEEQFGDVFHTTENRKRCEHCAYEFLPMGKSRRPHHNDCIVLLGDAVAKNRLSTRCVGHQTGNGTASMKQRTK